MHHWEKGGPISIGWPDHHVPEREYTIVEVQVAASKLGFKVIVSDLRCSIEGNVLRSFDYECYPTPEFAARPSDLTRTIAETLEEMRDSG